MISNENVMDLTKAIDHLTSTLQQLVHLGLGEPRRKIEDALAYRWHRSRGFLGESNLIPIHAPQLISFKSLQNIDRQTERLRQNTFQFVSGFPANNALMTGARGTGKSSLVRACLDEFSPLGLRLIEVEKQYLDDLPEIVSLVKDRPEKYLIFCDDLSFEDGDHGYKGLKTVLDGSSAGPPENVLIYATSNRRHMVTERAKDNLEFTNDDNGDLHPGDTVEEKISLSERFGLHLHFYGFNETQYLNAAAHWLATYNISLGDDAEIRVAALRFALERGARSGRVAAQFARDYVGQRRLAVQENETAIA